MGNSTMVDVAGFSVPRGALLVLLAAASWGVAAMLVRGAMLLLGAH